MASLQIEIPDADVPRVKKAVAETVGLLESTGAKPLVSALLKQTVIQRETQIQQEAIKPIPPAIT